jgi:hypothetical protein
VVFAVLSRPAARAALLLTPRAGSAGSTGTPTKRKVIARRTSREHTRRVLGGQGPQPGSGGHNRAKVGAAPPSRPRKDMAPRERGPVSGMTGMPLSLPLRAAGRAEVGSDWRQRACCARKRGGGKQDGAQPQAEKQSVS